MNIGAVCTREVATCRTTDTALDVAKLLRTRHVGDVFVLDEREDKRVLCGIVTDRDLVLAVIADEIDPASVFVSELMSAPLVVALESDGIELVLRRMRLHGVRRVPVTNALGELVGVASADDLLDAITTLLDDLRHIGTRQMLFEHKGRS